MSISRLSEFAALVKRTSRMDKILGHSMKAIQSISSGNWSNHSMSYTGRELACDQAKDIIDLGNSIAGMAGEDLFFAHIRNTELSFSCPYTNGYRPIRTLSPVNFVMAEVAGGDILAARAELTQVLEDFGRIGLGLPELEPLPTEVERVLNFRESMMSVERSVEVIKKRLDSINMHIGDIDELIQYIKGLEPKLNAQIKICDEFLNIFGPADYFSSGSEAATNHWGTSQPLFGKNPPPFLRGSRSPVPSFVINFLRDMKQDSAYLLRVSDRAMRRLQKDRSEIVGNFNYLATHFRDSEGKRRMLQEIPEGWEHKTPKHWLREMMAEVDGTGLGPLLPLKGHSRTFSMNTKFICSGANGVINSLYLHTLCAKAMAMQIDESYHGYPLTGNKNAQDLKEHVGQLRVYLAGLKKDLDPDEKNIFRIMKELDVLDEILYDVEASLRR